MMAVRNTDTNQTWKQIREIFRYAEKYGLEQVMDEKLAEQVRGIRYQESGITGDLFHLWDRSNPQEKELIEKTFEIMAGRSFEAFVGDVYSDISQQAKVRLCSELPPHPFPMPAPGYNQLRERAHEGKLRI